MTGLVVFYIFLWTGILGLAVLSGRAGAKERIRKDANYSFKKLYEGREPQTV